MVDDSSDDGIDDLSDAEDPPGGPPADNSGPMTGWQRLSQTYLRPPKPASQSRSDPVDLSTLSDAERQRRITQIDGTERKIGLVAAVLAAVLSLIATVPYMVKKTVVETTVKPVHKTCADGFKYTAKTATCNTIYPASHYTFYLVVLLIFSLAIFITVRIGRRAPLAFAITITGLAIATVLSSLIIALPFLAGGGWLLLRAWRTQKYGSPTAKAPVEGYVRPSPGASRPAKTGTSGTARNSTHRTRRRGQSEEPQDARKPPTQNKRYTPKAPPKKKVPPPG
jgi:hypothetical protein